MSKIISLVEVRQHLVSYFMQDENTPLPIREQKVDVAVRIFNTILQATGNISLAYLRGKDFVK